MTGRQKAMEESRRLNRSKKGPATAKERIKATLRGTSVTAMRKKKAEKKRKKEIAKNTAYRKAQEKRKSSSRSSSRSSSSSSRSTTTSSSSSGLNRWFSRYKK